MVTLGAFIAAIEVVVVVVSPSVAVPWTIIEITLVVVVKIVICDKSTNTTKLKIFLQLCFVE